MRIIILLIFIFSFYNTCSASNWDYISTEEVDMKWEQKNGFMKSDLQIIRNGVLRDYGDIILWKYRLEGALLEKKTGRIIRKITQVENNNSLIPENLVWDLSYSDTSTIMGLEIGNSTGDINYIISKNSNNLDTIYSWTTNNQFYYQYEKSKNNFYSLTDNIFLAQIDHSYNRGKERRPVQRKLLIDIEKDTIINIENLNLNSMKSYNNDSVVIFTNDNFVYTQSYHEDYPDTHNLYLNNENGFQQSDEIVIDESNWFKEIINDSICVTMYKDTVVLYNFQNNSRYSITPTQGNENPIGTYWNEDRNTIDIAFGLNGDSTKIMSIHYTSKNLIKNEKVVAPYLGRFVMNTGDGYTLSIGEGGFLYKHVLSIFKTDSLTADFSFKNTADYELQFSDESFGAVTEWEWDFGNGNTSNERHPINKFASAGTNEVQLIVTDEYGKKDTIVKQVKVTQKLNSEFDFEKFTGQAPFTVQFKNYASDNAIRYIWNFGDGTYSYEMEPAHTYSLPGEYSISLTVFDENENYRIFVQPKTIVATE